jgi:hypothetical protein
MPAKRKSSGTPKTSVPGVLLVAEKIAPFVHYLRHKTIGVGTHLKNTGYADYFQRRKLVRWSLCQWLGSNFLVAPRPPKCRFFLGTMQTVNLSLRLCPLTSRQRLMAP